MFIYSQLFDTFQEKYAVEFSARKMGFVSLFTLPASGAAFRSKVATAGPCGVKGSIRVFRLFIPYEGIAPFSEHFTSV